MTLPEAEAERPASTDIKHWLKYQALTELTSLGLSRQLLDSHLSVDILLFNVWHGEAVSGGTLVRMSHSLGSGGTPLTRSHHLGSPHTGLTVSHSQSLDVYL